MKTIVALTGLSTILVCLAASAQTQPRAAGSGLAERFKQLDRDGDGKVSATEFPGGQFKQIDKDGDGFATLEEAQAFYSGQRQPAPAMPPDPTAAATANASP
ncbi:MAG: hypothetical protein FJ221_14235, partial [Lentisphaerae bacterium]|nr:hypothetical protein [Lentisphaerota bacterium]